MKFEDAVKMFHDVSERLAILIEIQDDAVLLAEGTHSYKLLKEEELSVSMDILLILSNAEQATQVIRTELEKCTTA